MQFGRRIAIHKSVKETNLIKLYFHSYGWFLLLFLNGMLCMIFSYRTLFFLCNLSILRAFAYSFISLFLALWSHFGYTECHFQAFILFALFVLCAILGVAVFLLCAADILLFRVFFLHDLMDDDTKNMCCVYYSTVIIACVTPNIQSN